MFPPLLLKPPHILYSVHYAHVHAMLRAIKGPAKGSNLKEDDSPSRT